MKLSDSQNVLDSYAKISRNKKQANTVANLYRQGIFPNFKTAFNLQRKLVNKKPTKIVNETLNYYVRLGEKNKKNEYHITAILDEHFYYYRPKKNDFQYYEKQTPVTEIINATTETEARQIFISHMENYQENDDIASDGWSYKVSSDFEITNIYEPPKTDNIINYNPKQMFMKSNKPIAHFNINVPLESDDYEDGECVINSFVKRYQPHLKKMNKTFFNKIAREEYLKLGKVYIKSQGVTPELLHRICIRLNISHYAFDITRNNFLKYVSTARNYPACVYFCSNNHMYQIIDNDEINKLVARTKTIRVKLSKVTPQKNNIYEVLPIIENVAFDNIEKHENSIIIYDQANLNEHFDYIIEKFGVVPKITKMKKHFIQSFEFNTKDNTKTANLILTTDPNDTKRITWKDVKKMCASHNVPFRNQSFGNLVNTIRSIVNDNKRISLTSKQRLEFYENNNACAKCNTELEYGEIEIDHIVALANGGNNNIKNLQTLCKSCHKEKTATENEVGYSILIDSTFNSQVKEIYNSDLAKSYAFIERDVTPSRCLKGPQCNKKLYSFDINKCRKNILYFNTHLFPVFTVLDNPQEYKKQTAPGLYYVESDSYFPLRGNGWYSYPLIEYCLNNHIIRQRDIKQVILSGNTAKSNYYKPIIDYFYNNEPEYKKACVNAMIGLFKPSPDREFWKSKFLTTCEDEAFYHYLHKDTGFINTLEIDDKKYYHYYETNKACIHKTEHPIYNMILDLEAIETHKLSLLIKNNGGMILDLNTDSVTAYFNKSYSGNTTPLGKLDNNNNVLGHYYPDGTPIYKTEDKERIKNGKMEKWQRTEIYKHIPLSYNIQTLTPEQIINKNEGIIILGRGGTGKTTFINQIQEHLTNEKIDFISLAPTNKACRHISKYVKAQTLHKFKYIYETQKSVDVEYIFIDEISMMSESFYSFFVMVKNTHPDLKFIISGDFEQLEPVEILNKLHDYEQSGALYDLVDGNKMNLTICRRADDEYFNLTDPENMYKIRDNKITFNNKEYVFNNEHTNKHLAFTNKKRIQINEEMMLKTIRRMNKEEFDKRLISLKKAKRKTSHIKYDETDIKINVLRVEKNNYNPNSQDMVIVEGMPLISCKNIKKLDVVNNEEYTVLSFTQTEITIIEPISEQTLTIDIETLKDSFLPAYCITVHKSQGCTFDFPYTIHEWSRFTSKMKYVALSRSSNFVFVNIV